MIILSNSRVELLIDPAHGCVVKRARIDGEDILRASSPEVNDALLSAYYPCVPYFGRIQTIEYRGRTHSLIPTHLTESPDIALHGEGWINPWTIEEQTHQHVKCTLKGNVHDGRFPAQWHAQQSISLTSDGFTIDLAVTNDDQHPIHMGLGLHPFFACLPQTTICFDYDTIANSQVTLHKESIANIFRNPTLLPAQPLDHSFIKWDGRAQIQSTIPGRSIILTADTCLLHVYHPPSAGFVCLEPITHLPGSFTPNHPSPVEPTEPGKSVSISMAIQLA